MCGSLTLLFETAAAHQPAVAAMWVIRTYTRVCVWYAKQLTGAFKAIIVERRELRDTARVSAVHNLLNYTYSVQYVHLYMYVYM